MKTITLLFLITAQIVFSQAPQLAYDINPGPNSSVPSNPILFGGNMYFSAYTSNYGSELTRFDGSSMPVRIADINVGPISSMTAVNPIEFNGKIYLTATNGINGYELWSYDGVNAPTMVMDINPGASSAFPDKFIVFNNKLLFYANNGVNGGEVWQYDGTNPPTMLFDSYVGSATSSSLATHFCKYNGKLYFSAKNSSGPSIIYQYDGISTPTQVFSNYLVASYIFSHNGKMYLAAYNTIATTLEYLNYDGINLNIEPNITGKILANLNGNVYFNKLSPDSNGNELWKYDGSTPPTIIADINPGSASSNPSSVTAYNNKIYFVANDGTNGPEVWVYDGTTASLTGLITPSVLDPNITFMMVYNNKLYFNANNGIGAGETGSELWVIDAPLSTNEFENSSTKIYPIPMNDVLNITTENDFDEVNIYDINGRRVLHSFFSLSKNKQLSIDLPKGFYTIQLNNNHQVIFTKKIIK